MAKSKNKYAGLNKNKEVNTKKSGEPVPNIKDDINTPQEIQPEDGGIGKKRRKLNKKKTVQESKKRVGLSDLEKEWLDLSISKPPPMPAETTLFAASQKGKNKKKSKNKGKLINIDELPWDSVKVPEGMVVSDDAGGFLGLEEIEGVDCEWVGNDSIGKYLTARIVNPSSKNSRPKNKANFISEPLSFEEMDGQDFIHVDDFSEGDESETEATPLPKRPLVPAPEYSDSEEEPGFDEKMTDLIPENTPEASEPEENDSSDDDFDLQCLPIAKKTPKQKKAATKTKAPVKVEDDFTPLPFLQNWSQFDLDKPILQAIQKLNFQMPSQIQQEALPHALRHRDIIGCAETGSGKTLAFGVPLIQRLSKLDLELPENDRLHGLILTPTRELAIQITDHLKAISQFLRIKISTTVGGMSIQKQERLFNKTPHIMIATPGRLWELMTQNDSYLNKVRGIQYLVLDEADRMVEKGHFKELEYILDLLNKSQASEESSSKAFNRRQTLVFSATLDNYFAQNKKGKGGRGKPSSTIDSILERIRFKDPKPLRIDLSSKKLTSENLVERRIDCVNAEKDLYLYFLVTRYPGRTLVFVNSIDTIRRLVPLLVLLGVNAYPLHAQMQQRQRLKNVDKFKSLESSVLISSDVASRGLDIPGVEHIIHYQLARTPDLYVHRSGRTARAQRQGISIMLCSPDELKSYKVTCRALKRDSIPEFPFDSILAAKLAPRINLAKKIDSLQHRLDKESTEKSWFIKNAEALEIELDDDYYKDSDQDDESPASGDKQKRQKLVSLKAELAELLSSIVKPLGTSSYITHGVRPQFLTDLQNRQDDGPFRGVATSLAIDDAQASRKRKC